MVKLALSYIAQTTDFLKMNLNYFLQHFPLILHLTEP